MRWRLPGYAAALSLAALVAVSPVQAGGWSALGGGPDRTSSVEAGIPAAMAVKWRTPTMGPVYGGPAVVEGTLYVGSDDGWLYALEASTGQLIWKFPVLARIRAVPAREGSRLFVGAYNGLVYALDAGTGWLLWTFATASWVPASPAVRVGLVIVSSYDGTVYALDGEDRTLRWSFNPGGDFLPGSPALAGGLVYVASRGGRIYALDADTGTLQWRQDLPGYSLSGPVIAGGVLYVSGDGRDGGGVFAFDARTGEPRWAFKERGGHWSAPAAGRSLVLVAARGKVYALDRGKGELKWALELPASGGRGPAPLVDATLVDAPLVDPERAVVPAGEELYVLDLEDGRILYRIRLPGRVASPLAFYEGALFFGGVDHFIYSLAAIRVYAGDKEVEFPGQPPLMYEGHLVVPVRPLLEALGFKVEWRGQDRAVIATRGKRRLWLAPGKETARVSGREIPAPLPAYLSEGKVLAPLRWLVRAVGGEVTWDPGSLVARIEYGEVGY